MRVRIDIGLDFDGIHAFDWKAAEGPGGVEVPRSTLERWTSEREAFQLAYLRWKRVMEEVEDFLYKAEEQQQNPVHEPALAVATVGARGRKPLR